MDRASTVHSNEGFSLHSLSVPRRGEERLRRRAYGPSHKRPLGQAPPNNVSALYAPDLPATQLAEAEPQTSPAPRPAEIYPLPVPSAAPAPVRRRSSLSGVPTGSIAAGLTLVFVMASGSLVAPGAIATRLGGALAVAAVGLALVYLVDGFAVSAFSSVRELARVLAGATVVGGAVALALAWRWPGVFSPVFAAELAAGIAVFGSIANRFAVGPAGSARSGARRRALVVTSPDGGPLGADLGRLDGRLDVIGLVVVPGRASTLRAALAFHRPDVVLVEASLSDVDFELVRLCSEQAIRVLVLQRPAYGVAGGGRVVRLAGLPWLPLRPLAVAPRHRRAKRALDLLLLAVAAPLVLPIMAGIAVAVASTSKGGVFYRQIRLGESGKPFVLFKFRTMYVDAERDTGPVFAGAADPRVTRAGRFLRPLRLDELPQLWNILRGEMTLVGPRPERPEFAADFSAVPEYDCRHLIQPGLTGLAQLVGGYSATAADKLRCDLLYLSSRSVRLDLRLIAATAAALVRGFPAG